MLRTVLASIALSTAAASVLLAQPAAEPTPRAATSGPTFSLDAGNPHEFDTVAEEAKLTPEQRKAFDAAMADRLAKLKAFVDGPEGKRYVELRSEMTKARREKRDDDAVKAREELAPLSQKYLALRQETRVAVFKTLDAQQLNNYVGGLLNQRITGALDRSKVKLTDEQRTKIRALCDEAAKTWAASNSLDTDPTFRGLSAVDRPTRERISKEVLTPEQRQTAEAAAAAAATRAAEGRETPREMPR